MKTNHKRSFVAPSENRRGNYVVFFQRVHLVLSDREVSAGVTMADGHPHNGIARSRRGAKRYINSRTRFHENQELRKITKEI